LEDELAAVRAENARLRALLGLDRERRIEDEGWKLTLFADARTDERRIHDDVVQSSPPDAKVALFRSLFAGRDDVYAVRWDNTRTGKAGWSPAVRGGWASQKAPDREYLPLTDERRRGAPRRSHSPWSVSAPAW
jgi:hypothetical protein